LDLEQLLVLHRLRPVTPVMRAVSSADGAPRPGFCLSTCQREIEIHYLARAAHAPRSESFRGIDAYRFLLEFATGLRSAIPGETNVFGQLRAAWRDYQGAADAAAIREFTTLMDYLFADTRAIRTAFLQDIGGHSYGTLTRKLLRGTAGTRILVVGYGALAQSVLPMLSGFELALINRTRPTDMPECVQRVFDASETAAALDWADHVVLCVPRAVDLDARWVSLLASRPGTRVIHLGCRRADRGPWATLAGVATLDDLFDLRTAQQDRRMRLLELARAACGTRALLRAANVARYQTSASRT